MTVFIRWKILLVFAFALLMLILLGIVTYSNTIAYREASARQQRSLTTINALGQVLILALDAETAARGYVLTGQDIFLLPFYDATGRVHQEIGGLRELFGNESDRLSLFHRLSFLIEERLEDSRSYIEVRQQQGYWEAAQTLAGGEGRRTTEEIRSVVEELRKAEHRQFLSESDLAASRQLNTLIFVVLETVLALFFMALAGIQIQREEKRRHSAEQALRETNLTLEEQVEQRTGELLRANESLQGEIEGHRKAEKMLSESEAKFANLLEAAPDAIFIINRKGHISFLNRAGEEMFGYDREALMDQPLELLIPDRYRQAHANHLGEFFNDPKTRLGNRVELYGRRKDGSEFPAEINLGSIAADREMLVASSFRDATERKELEDRLRQSEKMDAIGRLAGGIAHDFNNFLTVINGYGDLLLTTLDEKDPIREKIIQIRGAGGHAAELTQQLLAFSRKQILQPRVLDLNQVVREVESMLRRVVREDIDIMTVLSPDAEPVMADPGQMSQVLMNLAVNARDAMPSGGNLVIETSHVDLDEEYASTHPEVQPGPHVLLIVSDSGVGMDQATRVRIFEPFFTTKQTGKGTGLGLATVYGIVKQAGGSIWVYSEPWKGTTFKVYLPRIVDAVPFQEKKPRILSLRGTETILVVEDQEDLRKLAKEVLQTYGYKILEAGNGSEALSKVGEYAGPIHMMVTDVIMPGITGRDAAERLKVLRPEMKVLYMSGYTDNVVVHRGIVEPGHAYLQKPFSPEALAEKVREVLGIAAEKARILVVEDEAAIRGIMRQMLLAAGYEVLEAEDVNQALKHAEHQTVDLIITDLMMSGQEEMEIVRRLHEQSPNRKIIAMSGAIGAEFLDAARELGVEETLPKPFHMDQLLAVVKRVLNR